MEFHVVGGRVTTLEEGRGWSGLRGTLDGLGGEERVHGFILDGGAPPGVGWVRAQSGSCFSALGSKEALSGGEAIRRLMGIGRVPNLPPGRVVEGLVVADGADGD